MQSLTFGKVQTADPLGVRVFGPDGVSPACAATVANSGTRVNRRRPTQRHRRCTRLGTLPALLLVVRQHLPRPLDALAEHVLERGVTFAFLNVLRDC